MKRTKRRKKEKAKVLHWSHILFIVVICLIFAAIFSLKTRLNHETTEKDILVISDANLTAFYDNSSKKALHNLSFSVENRLDEKVICSLNFTLTNETDKESTFVTLPALGPREKSRQEIIFEMLEGNVSMDLKPSCVR
ncbi:MAG: hypothetical protein KKF44_03940 [Nanoarchaeota archaeon]|nr:hypothetical protein [Nanoarchaeota archaeon]